MRKSTLARMYVAAFGLNCTFATLTVMMGVYIVTVINFIGMVTSLNWLCKEYFDKYEEKETEDVE